MAFGRLPMPPPAIATVSARCSQAHAARIVPRCPRAPPIPSKDAALIVDGATGKVLYARNETAERHPASLTKMMTLYLLFEALKAGKITMQTPMPVSRARRGAEADQALSAPGRDHHRGQRHPRHRGPLAPMTWRW